MEFDEGKCDSNKPSLSPFHQQKLKGWQPIINTNNLYIPFFVIGFIFAVVGSVLVYYSYQLTEYNYNYTDCLDINNNKCSDQLYRNNLTSSYQSCQCIVNIHISQDIKGPAYFYYGLTHFFQNHRRYVKSRDDNQLKGLSVSSLAQDCDPYRYANSTTVLAYAPCGTIANSLFNDTFRLDSVTNNSAETLSWTNKGIAWPSETNVRYGRPTDWSNTVKPVNWPISARDRSPLSYSGDEELIVWLRTAALPNFKKLHRIIPAGVPKGDYKLYINYSYPVKAFQGTKSFIIAETNYLGGKNPAMGIIYLIVGILYFVLALIFLCVNASVAKRRQDEAWIISNETGNGFANQTFNATEAGDHSQFVDQCISDVNMNLV